MTRDDVDVIAHDPRAFTGYFRIERWRFRHRLFAGGWSGEMEREVFERGHAVAVILYDPERDLLILIEQFRIGAYAAGACHPLSPWLIEIVAGIIDEGEPPEAVARRECLEESGCQILDLLPACRILASPGGTSETVQIFCARVSAEEVGGIHGLDDEHEDIRVFTATPAEVFRWLDEGRIVNATAVVGLQWFRIHGERVRAAWLGDHPANLP